MRIKDQLLTASEFVYNNDFIVVALSGFPREYSTIRTVILTRDTSISFREFRDSCYVHRESCFFGE